MDLTDRDTFFAGLALLMSWRSVGSFRARVIHRLGDEGTESRLYDLEASPQTLSYKLVNTKTGAVDSFDWAERRRVEHSQRVEESVAALTPEPLPARLAFPLSLGVWGRSIDDYRFDGTATSEDDLVHLGLVHTKAPGLHGRLSIDSRRRHAVRLDTPVHLLAYESIEPLG